MCMYLTYGPAECRLLNDQSMRLTPQALYLVLGTEYAGQASNTRF